MAGRPGSELPAVTFILLEEASRWQQFKDIISYHSRKILVLERFLIDRKDPPIIIKHKTTQVAAL